MTAREIFFWSKAATTGFYADAGEQPSHRGDIWDELQDTGRGEADQFHFSWQGGSSAQRKIRERPSLTHRRCPSWERGWHLVEVPPVAKPALKREMEGPNWRKQSPSLQGAVLLSPSQLSQPTNAGPEQPDLPMAQEKPENWILIWNLTSYKRSATQLKHFPENFSEIGTLLSPIKSSH